MAAQSHIKAKDKMLIANTALKERREPGSEDLSQKQEAGLETSMKLGRRWQYPLRESLREKKRGRAIDSSCEG